ncbi:MAG: NAD-dependent epimerase/dehydratase family protein [Pseudomonadota bacterium]
MKCLVVGGTGFLGGAIVDALAEDGHEVSILTRGKTNRSLPLGVKAIHADRFGDLSALQNTPFEWVFDTCAFEPDAVRRLLAVVGERCQRYVLISSISVYGRFTQKGLSETNAVPGATDNDLAVAAGLSEGQRGSASAYGASYGPLKRACEIAAQDCIGDRATSLRVGLLIGAGDYMDRLTWWVRRIDQATNDRKRIPAPAPKDRLVQMIDVADVADFALRCAENELSGLWNVTGAPEPFEGVMKTIIDETGSDADLVWISEQSILKAGISPWTDIPLMAPPVPEFRYFLEVSTQKAVDHGLICRPLSNTLRSLITWDRTQRDRTLIAGMSEEQEAALLS